jgi:hypothetical protein
MAWWPGRARRPKWGGVRQAVLPFQARRERRERLFRRTIVVATVVTENLVIRGELRRSGVISSTRRLSGGALMPPGRARYDLKGDRSAGVRDRIGGRGRHGPHSPCRDPSPWEPV